MVRFSACFLLLLFLVAGLRAAEPIEVAAKDKPPENIDDRVPWVPAQDMQVLAGRWEMVSGFEDWQQEKLPTDRHSRPILTHLFKQGVVLRIVGEKFIVEGSPDAGTLINTINDDLIFRPANEHWINTQEPQIIFDLKDSSSRAVFSYVVSSDAVHFRFPANSCSRSGIRFSLKRVVEKQTKTTSRNAVTTEHSTVDDSPLADGIKLNARQVKARAAQLLAAGRLAEVLSLVQSYTEAGTMRAMPKLLWQLHTEAIAADDPKLAIAALQYSVLSTLKKTRLDLTAREFNRALLQLAELADTHEPDVGARATIRMLLEQIDQIPEADYRVDGSCLSRAAVIAQQTRYLYLDGHREQAHQLLTAELIPNRQALKQTPKPANIAMRARAAIELLNAGQQCDSNNCLEAELRSTLVEFMPRVAEKRFVQIYVSHQLERAAAHVRTNPEFSQRVLHETRQILDELKAGKSHGNIFEPYDGAIAMRLQELGSR